MNEKPRPSTKETRWNLKNSFKHDDIKIGFKKYAKQASGLKSLKILNIAEKDIKRDMKSKRSLSKFTSWYSTPIKLRKTIESTSLFAPMDTI